MCLSLAKLTVLKRFIFVSTLFLCPHFTFTKSIHLLQFFTLGSVQLLHKHVRGGWGVHLKNWLLLTEIGGVGGSEGKCLCNTWMVIPNKKELFTFYPVLFKHQLIDKLDENGETQCNLFIFFFQI